MPTPNQLAGRLARRHDADPDELFSVGLMALAEAIRAFRDIDGTDRGFGELIDLTVRRAIGEHFRVCRPMGFRTAGARERHGGNGPATVSGTGLIEILDDAPEVGWDTEYGDWIEWLARQLPSPDRQILLVRIPTAKAGGFPAGE